MREKTDKELIEEYISGNESAFGQLVSRHMDNVYKFTYRYFNDGDKADDATQETFVKAWKNIRRFDTNRKFITWLFAIAKNTCLDMIKKKAPVPFSSIEAEKEMDMAELVRDESPLPDELAEIKDKKMMIANALGKLPVDYRMVLFLRYNDHFKFREIAESLGESLNTIKSRHLRGIKMMKKLLEGQ